LTEREQRTRDELGSLFKELSYEQLRVAVHSLRVLVWEFTNAVGLQEPYYVVPDNSLLQDIRHAFEQDGRLARYAGIQSFAYFLRNYTNLDVRLVITPAIFFESIGRRELKSESDYKQVLRQLHSELAPLGIRIMILGIESYRKARALCSLILRDGRSIMNILKDVKSSEWDIPLRKGVHKYPIRNPMALADELLPCSMKLEYFNPWYVRLALVGIVERAILESRLNKGILRGYLSETKNFITGSIIKVRKNELKGLGDIELFQYCDIRSQFISKSPTTYVGLTFDENLAKVLGTFSNLIARSEEIRGGEDERSIMKKWENYQKELNRLTQVEEAQKVFRNNYVRFLDDLKPVIVSLEDKLKQ
jgi:hypothetical protein